MNKVYELEPRLFKKEFLCDREYLENIFHDDFMEYGKSGKVYKKRDTIEALYNKGDRDIKVEDFIWEKLDYKTYIVHYVSFHDKTSVYRTSIWIDNGLQLQLYFHQGTIRNDC